MDWANFVKDTVITIAVIVALLVVGGRDYRNKKLDVDRYCKMVHEKAIPDYLGIAKDECL